jgi:fructoselysine 6-phosphate deglycase
MGEVEKNINRDALFFASDATAPGLINLEKRLLPALKEIARRISQAKSPRLSMVGGGASLSASISGKYLFDRFTTAFTEATNGWQFVSREPFALGSDSFVFAVSYSGQTPEVLEAVRLAKSKKAVIIAITNTKETPLAMEADFVLDYQNKAVYTVPLAIYYWIAAFVMKYRSENSHVGDQIIGKLKELPALYPELIERTRPFSRKLAEEFTNEVGFYVLGSGPLYGLAYKLALSVVIENLWIDGCPIESGDFYHGPIEIVPPNGNSPQRMAFIHLVGTDKSRHVSLQAINFCEKRGMRQIVYDAIDYPEFGEIFSPFALFVPTEWFIMYMSALKEHDVDERRYMGKLTSRWGEYGAG